MFDLYIYSFLFYFFFQERIVTCINIPIDVIIIIDFSFQSHFLQSNCCFLYYFSPRLFCSFLLLFISFCLFSLTFSSSLLPNKRKAPFVCVDSRAPRHPHLPPIASSYHLLLSGRQQEPSQHLAANTSNCQHLPTNRTNTPP